MRRKVSALIVTVGAFLALPAATFAHAPGDKIVGRCSIINTAGQAQMVVEVDNVSGGSLKNVDPNQLYAANIGTASIFFQTTPRPLRELLDGKTGTFKWKGRLFGDGYLDLSVEVEAEAEDGHVGTTGVVNCNRVTVGDPGSIDPPPTREQRGTATARPQIDTPTPRPTVGRPTRTPRPTSTSRPTRTPIVARPTRTPRATSTPRATNTARPTRTPIEGRPTRTPRATSTPRPTRTSIAARATRTPIQFRPTRTPASARATRTPIPARPTRTPRPTSTRRPTRTPIGNHQATATARPTRTPESGDPDPNYDLNGLRAHCSLRRNIDAVTVTMLVENRSGVDIRSLEASALDLAPEGGALFFDRAGPIPSSYTIVRNGFSISYQWTGRLTPGGTMGFAAYVRGTTPDHREIRTDLIDCGTAAAEGDFSHGQFNGSCTIRDGDLGGIDLVVNNNSGVALTNVVPRLRAQDTSGSAQVLNLSGPVPNGTTRLNNTQQILYAWRARILGRGTVSMQFEATATRPNAEGVSTGIVTCSREVNTVGGNLPDLTISEDDLRNSLEIHTENFPVGDCAIEEGCVDGPGTRRLLRFDTVTPNLGPGDVFVGDPAGNNNFIFSQCHAHYHFEEYADYRLLDMQGNLVRRGHKQAFCLIDLFRLPGGNGNARPQFPDCGFQGISAGWADIYNRALDCQWVDITGVPEGRYVLEVDVNPAHVIDEGNYSNNRARTEVFIPRP